MPRRLPKLVVTVNLVALIAAPYQLWGQLVTPYSFSYVTTGSFACNTYYVAYCTVTGNEVAISNGGSVLTFSFTGTSGQATVIPGDATYFTIGTLNESLTGSSPFIYPYNGIFNVPIFSLSIALSNPAFSGQPGGWLAWAIPIPATPTTALYGWIRSQVTGVPGTPVEASALADTYPLPGDGSSLSLPGEFSIAPEPNTLVLLATGVAVLAIAWRASGRRGNHA
jgi:hypothetical protein